jgi:hypothetical protein
MINVLQSRRWRSSRIWRGAIWCLSLTLLPLATSATMAQPPTSKPRPPEAASPDSAKAKAAVPADDDAPAPDIANVPVADPSQTRKVAPIEVFKDPSVAQLQLLDVTKFKPLPASPYSPTDVLLVKEMAGNKNATIDRSVIERVVKGLAAKLTEKAGIQALIETPEEEAISGGEANKVALKKAQADAAARSDAAKVIPQATSDLLEPIFIARGAGNLDFLTVYQRALNQSLPPLLSNHLVPRVQAMIVLGESGSTESMAIFEKEIGNPKQTLWVKLWAIEGIKKIKEFGGRLSSDAEAKAARAVADFLDKSQPLPWPVQLRALEALGYLRQGFLPTAPGKAHMANTAMRFLADPEARLEVRAEAARALGLMQITSAVSKFNFSLPAYGAGLLAADLGSQINALYSDTPPRVENLTKAKYLTALLVGPVYQAFDGISTQRDSGGLLRMASAPSLDYVQKVFGLVKQVAQSSVELLGAPPKQFKDRKKTLSSQIAALRTFLDQNPPPSRSLVQGGQEFVAAGGEAEAEVVEPAKPLGRTRGR